MYVGGINVLSDISRLCSNLEIINNYDSGSRVADRRWFRRCRRVRLWSQQIGDGLWCVSVFPGIRTEQDLYVRLIDSMTKQVRTPQTLNPEPPTMNPEPLTLNPEPLTLNPNPRPLTLIL